MKQAWSYSSLKHFEQCPKSYHAQRIAKTHKQEDFEYLKWGNIVHEHLENRIKHGTPLPAGLEDLEMVCAGLEASGMKLYAELEIAFTRDWKPTTYWSPDAWTRGKIDVIGLKPDGSGMILDWKTGKRRPDFGQLEYYALALALNGIRRVECCFVWIKTRESDFTVVSEHDAQIIKRSFERRAGLLEEAYETNHWPAKTSALCAYCPVVQDCEEAREKRYHIKAQHIRKARKA